MRIAKRVRDAVGRGTIPLSDEKPLFPFDTVRSYLERLPLLFHLDVEAKEVHSVLLDIHFLSSGGREEKKEKPLAPNCKECGKGYLLLDGKEGNEVCVRCGAVSCSSIHGEGEYLPHTERMCEEETSSFREELEHWNAATSLSDEKIDSLVLLLGRWKKGNKYSRKARVAGSLLYPSLKDSFPDEREVRELVRRGKRIPEVDPTPKPTFPCKECSSLCFTWKSARYHCKIQFGKRRKMNIVKK